MVTPPGDPLQRSNRSKLERRKPSKVEIRKRRKAERRLGCGKFLFSLGGVGPPRTRGSSFHETNSGDEGVENARVLPGAGSSAQGLVKGARVPANQVLRLFDPDRSQIAGDRFADVGDCFEDCGQSRMGRLACGHLERRKAEGERRKGR